MQKYNWISNAKTEIPLNYFKMKMEAVHIDLPNPL